MIQPNPFRGRFPVVYPDSDGKPMADNTLQFEWIVTIKGNLDALYRDDANVFVGGDLLWYPVEGRPTIRQAPDVLTAFGRPKGYRGSYRQWEEGGIAPQVVFEVLSPGNRAGQMRRKLRFYERYGVEEYYIYDPDRIILTGYLRHDGKFEKIPDMHDWVSPRLGIRFDMSGDQLVIYRPDGRPFATFVELEEQRAQAERQTIEAQRQTEEAQRQTEEAQRQTEEAQRQTEEAQQQAEQERQAREQLQQQAEQERQAREQLQQQADQARLLAEQLAAQLRALGVEPETGKSKPRGSE
jgi:Uma2 family endonuclease